MTLEFVENIQYVQNTEIISKNPVKDTVILFNN